MRGIWERWYIRMPVAAVVVCAACYVTLWYGQMIANIIVIKAGVGLMTQVNTVVTPPYLQPTLLLGVLPIAPFWLLAETGHWYRGKPLPLGSYLLFTPLFFFGFYVSALVDIGQNKDNAMMGVLMLVAAYVGAALLAGAAAWGYYLAWRKRQERLPATELDVF